MRSLLGFVFLIVSSNSFARTEFSEIFKKHSSTLPRVDAANIESRYDFDSYSSQPEIHPSTLASADQIKSEYGKFVKFRPGLELILARRTEALLKLIKNGYPNAAQKELSFLSYECRLIEKQILNIGLPKQESEPIVLRFYTILFEHALETIGSLSRGEKDRVRYMFESNLAKINTPDFKREMESNFSIFSGDRRPYHPTFYSLLATLAGGFAGAHLGVLAFQSFLSPYMNIVGLVGGFVTGIVTSVVGLQILDSERWAQDKMAAFGKACKMVFGSRGYIE